MRPATVWQFKFNLAGDEFPLPPLAPGWRFLQGLIEATSNFGQAAVLDWEWANPMVAATAIPNRFSLMILLWHLARHDREAFYEEFTTLLFVLASTLSRAAQVAPWLLFTKGNHRIDSC